MRTTKTISVSMPPAQLKEVEKLAKRENRTMSELVREALRHYQRERLQEEARTSLAAAMAAMQEDAARKGLAKLTMREINAEIAAYRKEQRQKRSTRPVK
jgi:metal-responsive CopG/Arc/MetJ family transcriptional regulator